MKCSQNTKEKKKYGRKIYYIDFTENKKLHFGCSVSFDHEQHKFDPQMNHTRGLSSKSAYQNDYEGSCDAEDLTNDAENSALHNRIQLNF